MFDLMQQGLAAQAATVKANKLAQFKALVEAHDMAYEMSDDASVYKKGKAQYAEIKALMAELDRAEAVTIWNAVVDEKFIAAVRAEFYMVA